MITINTIFEKYTERRLKGQKIETVYSDLRDMVVNNLTREERNTLSIKCDQWERDRTQPDLTRMQQQALKRAALTNITLKIIFCPACDTPNAENFTRCQVCDEPLAVEHVKKGATTGIMGSKGDTFERHTQLILKVANSNDRLVMQPQISPTGLKIGRRTVGTDCDVDLDPFGGGDYGVSRSHAVIRYDKVNDRLILIDMGSTNGTYINGDKMRPNRENILSDGDELKLARMVFRVQFKG